jgi:MFS family permease
MGSLLLLPMSVTSFFSSKLMILVGRWIRPAQMLPLGMTAFALSLLMFATSRHQLWEIFVTMGLAGIGIGCSFTVMPRMIVSAAPPEDTGSALALNQVLRMIGMSVGSALSATILTAHTPAGMRFPDDRGYTIGAVAGIVLCIVTAIIAVALQARVGRPRPSSDTPDDLSVIESVDAAIAGVVAFEAEESEEDTASAGVGTS